MIRLYVVAEGVSEVRFIGEILQPHLEGRKPGRIEVRAPNLGGYRTFGRLKKDVQRLLADRDAVVTTMIDLFKVPGDFPGRNDPQPNARQRVAHMERLGAEAVGNDRFHPYLQLHEFEALVLADLGALAKQYPARGEVLSQLGEKLGKQFAVPEDVNDTRPPSHHILEVVPEYNKAADGAAVLAAIGLERLRKRCPHFGDWCGWIETVG